MGKMKEKFIDEMNGHDFGSPSDADYQDYLYPFHPSQQGCCFGGVGNLDSLHPKGIQSHAHSFRR